MKNPQAVAKYSLIAISVLFLVMFMAGVVIPNITG